MSIEREFLENGEGVHIMNGEFTLCGDSFDIAETERDFEDGSTKRKREFSKSNVPIVLE